jgi:hypothetical protein
MNGEKVSEGLNFFARVNLLSILRAESKLGIATLFPIDQTEFDGFSARL